MAKGKLRSIHIEPSDDNGFMCTMRHQMSGNEKNRFDMDADTTKTVHESPESLINHLSTHLGAKTGKSEQHMKLAHSAAKMKLKKED